MVQYLIREMNFNVQFYAYLDCSAGTCNFKLFNRPCLIKKYSSCMMFLLCTILYIYPQVQFQCTVRTFDCVILVLNEKFGVQLTNQRNETPYRKKEFKLFNISKEVFLNAQCKFQSGLLTSSQIDDRQKRRTL